MPEVDGDGHPDYLIAADQETVLETASSGHVRLYSGATGAYLRSFLPQVPGTQSFGATVKGIGDLDGDGRGEVLISSHLEFAPGQQGGAPTGVVYVFSGATGAVIHILWPPPGTGGSFGIGLDAVPDATGDGVPDILVGADQGLTGRVHLFSGATGEHLRTLDSAAPQLNGWFGHSVAGVPDLDGDGRGDLLVGAWGEDIVGTIDGRAYVYSGATGALLHTLQAPIPDFAYYGIEVAGLPDLDGDGRGDLLVGAPFAAGPELPGIQGRAFVYSGGTGELLYILVPPYTQFSSAWGNHVSPAPDLDGDGRPELLVSSHNQAATPPLRSGGAAHLFSGADGRLLRTFISPNAQQNGGFAASIAAAALPSGPRRAEVLFGAPGERFAGVRTGTAYAFASCRADTDADGRINSRDLTRFLTGWIQTAALPPGELGPPGVHHGDFNADGLVNSADISEFLAQWLETVSAGGCP